MKQRVSSDALLSAGLGFLLVTSLPRPVVPPPSGLIPEGLGVERERDPGRMNFRELQRLPRIGPARARAIVEERHRNGPQGGVRAWDAIPGIGPETVSALEEALQVRDPPAHSRADECLTLPRGERTLRPDPAP